MNGGIYGFRGSFGLGYVSCATGFGCTCSRDMCVSSVLFMRGAPESSRTNRAESSSQCRRSTRQVGDGKSPLKERGLLRAFHTVEFGWLSGGSILILLPDYGYGLMRMCNQQAG